MSKQLKWCGGAVAFVAVGLIIGALFFAAAVAHGQGAPASQPIVIPVSLGFWPWLAANSSWVVPLVILLLSSVVTGLSDYPKAEGAVKVLRILLSGLSLVQFKDGKGSLKLPGTPPAPPLSPADLERLPVTDPRYPGDMSDPNAPAARRRG
jgi:hypothetical protein